MKHNIRINGEIKEIDCELGSGVYDKNGKEIFEGDKVYVRSGLDNINYPCKVTFSCDCFPLLYMRHGNFYPPCLHAWSNTQVEKTDD